MMKTVIITGAGKGLGFETTKSILANLPDFKVIAISRNTNQLKKIEGRNLQIITADLTSQMNAVLMEIGDQKIDGLLNNAGVIIKNDIRELSYSNFETIFKTNVFVPFDLSVKLTPNFNKGAHILNIGSMGGFENTIKFPQMAFYSSSKSALHCLSQCLSLEFSSLEVRVNCLAIGAAETEMVKIAFPDFKAPITAQTMAEFMAWFLINGHKFMNGQIIPVALGTV
jgi:short-subunit dehydrogenase